MPKLRRDATDPPAIHATNALELAMSVVQYSNWVELKSEFDTLRAQLQELSPDRRETLLAHYVRPTDRCIPTQLLDRSLDATAGLDFDDLQRLPAVGFVKLRNLNALLLRIVQEGTAFTGSSAAADALASETLEVAEPVVDAASVVNEVQWKLWCDRVTAHSLDSVVLGRVVERLSDLPRGMWHERLGGYLGLSLEAIRRLPTHGHKRVAVIVDTVSRLSRLCLAAEACPGGGLVIGPERIAAVDAWVVDALLGRTELSAQAFTASVAVPLLDQLAADVGPTVYGWAAERLSRHLELPEALRPASGSTPWSQRLSSSRLQQLHQEATAVLRVRWPRGEDAARALIEGRRARRGEERGIAAALCEWFPSNVLDTWCGR